MISEQRSIIRKRALAQGENTVRTCTWAAQRSLQKVTQPPALYKVGLPRLSPRKRWVLSEETFALILSQAGLSTAAPQFPLLQNGTRATRPENPRQFLRDSNENSSITNWKLKPHENLTSLFKRDEVKDARLYINGVQKGLKGLKLWV